MEETSNDELKEMLEESIKLSRDNNEMLSKLYRSYKRGRLIKIIYWSVIIFITFGAYYFIKPLLDSLGGAYSTVKTQIEGVHTVGESIKNAF